jgi:hypothetical protein
VEWPALDRHSRQREAVHAMKTEMNQPRQCIKCRGWFYDSIFYREGRYGCRWHDCDRIDQITRMAGWRMKPKGWWERLKERLSHVHR